MKTYDCLCNPRVFIPEWFREKKLMIKGNLVIHESQHVFEMFHVINGLWLDYQEEIRAFNVGVPSNRKLRGFPEKDLSKALEEFLEIKRREALEEVRMAIKCENENLDELKRFLVAATGKCDEIELAMLAHAIWQVKRKMFNKKVKDHVMIIFKGKQGAGKTEAMKILFQPIKPWFKGASLQEITDDRWKFFFKNSYVVFCDELQHAEWASVDALKNIISAEEFESRRLGTNIYDNVIQNCSFVGATNKSVGELIRDTTGMRRFFQLETLSKINWDEINAIDPLKIWQGIDEKKNEPYIAPFKQAIHEIQTELILPDAEDDFLAKFKLLDGSKDIRTKFLTNRELFENYALFGRLNGERQKPSNAFHRKMKASGMREFAERQGPHGSKGYFVTEDSYELISKYKSENLFS